MKVAFGSGWLGVESFGFSTFVQVVDIDPEDYEVACRLLAGRFLTDLGAPDALTALDAARGEIDDAATIAGDHDEGMLLAIEREPDESLPHNPPPGVLAQRPLIPAEDRAPAHGDSNMFRIASNTIHLHLKPDPRGTLRTP